MKTTTEKINHMNQLAKAFGRFAESNPYQKMIQALKNVGAINTNVTKSNRQKNYER